MERTQQPVDYNLDVRELPNGELQVVKTRKRLDPYHEDYGEELVSDIIFDGYILPFRKPY